MTTRRHMKKKLRTALIVLAPLVTLVILLLAWRPWYTPKPRPVLDPWVHISYSHEELQQAQKLADSGKRSDLLDPRKTLTSFVATDASGEGSFDLHTQNLNITHVQSIQDEGKDPKNGDRLFLVTFSQQENVVVFRLRQLLGTEQTKIWSVIGYLITSSSSSRVSYSTTWQESGGPSGQ